MNNPWFPRNFEIIPNVRLLSLKYEAQLFQIFSANNNKNVLFINKELKDFCGNSIAIFFDKISHNTLDYFYYISDSDYALEPIVERGELVLAYDPYNDALSFAASIANTRKLGITASLEKGIFIEKLSLILPTPVESKPDDELLLGTWLSGGVSISVQNRKRLQELLRNMPDDKFENIIRAANMSPAPLPEAPKLEEKSEEIKTHNPVPKTPFSLPGAETLEAFFKDHIIDIVQHPERYARMGIDFPAPFVLQGPPGCGKTYAVEQLSKYLNWPTFHIGSETIGSPYIHETGRKIADLFDAATEVAPSIVIIDEMESFLADRTSGFGSSRFHLEEVGEFLRCIQEARDKRILVAAMTNMIEQIDKAVIRKGRFDHIIEIGMPTAASIKAVLAHMLKDIPHEGLNIALASKKLEGKSMAEIAFAVREASRAAAKNRQDSITTEIFEEVLKNIQTEDSQQNSQKSTLGFRVEK